MHIQRILAVFDSTDQARAIASRLRGSGVADDAISMVAADSVTARSLLAESDHHAAEGAVNGVAVGAGAAAIAVSAGVIATGPVGLLLGGVAAGGVAGGLLGALIGLGIPRTASELYLARFDRGAVMVAVDCADSRMANRVREILGASGPVHVAVVDEPARELTGSSV